MNDLMNDKKAASPQLSSTGILPVGSQTSLSALHFYTFLYRKKFEGKRPFFLAASLLFILLLAGLPRTVHASCGGSTNVSNTNQFNNAIGVFNNASGSCGTFTIVLTSDMTLTENLVEINNDANNLELVIDGGNYTLNGDAKKRQLLRIKKAKNVTLKNLNLTAGKEDGIRLDEVKNATLENNKVQLNGRYGLQIIGDGSTITVSNHDVLNNNNNGINIKLNSSSLVTIETSVIQSNGNHGVYREGPGIVQVEQSLVDNNSNQGVRSRSGATYVVAATVSNNADHGLSNGVQGGAESSLDVYNSTITINGKSGIRREKGDLKIVNSTITANEERGINITSGQTVDIFSTILYGNADHDCRRASGHSATVNISHSIVGTYNRCGDNIDADSSNNLLATDPKFGSFAPHGGSEIGYLNDGTTNKMSLYAIANDSPALDAGTNTHADIARLDYDQRGQTRKVKALLSSERETVDMGAFELQQTGLSGTAVSSSTTSFSPVLLITLAGVLFLGVVGVVIWRRRQ